MGGLGDNVIEKNEIQAFQVQPQALTVRDVRLQINQIQELMKDCMTEGQHYGKIPGTDKPTLYKAGAEKLGLMFRLDPEYEVLSRECSDEFVGYTIRCVLFSMASGARVASGMGSCNSKEKKYRSREARDLDNTILKMACKRAHVAAVLNGTAASDIFTQDLEDMVDAHIVPETQKAPGSGAPKISEPQAKRLFAIARSTGKSDDEIKAYLSDNFGIENSRDITRDAYDQICTWAGSKAA